MTRPWEQQASVPAPTDLRALAHKAHAEGDSATAERHYRQLLAVGGFAADAANLGALLRRQGRLADALEVYRAALRQGTDDPSLVCNAANAMRQAGDLEKSAVLLRRALQNQPHDPAIQHGLAKTLLAQGQPAQALAILQALLKEGSQGHELWFDHGVAQARLGELEQALGSFDQALQGAPRNVVIVAGRITLLTELKRWGPARDALEQARSQGLAGLDLLAAEAGLLMAEQQMAEAAALFVQLCEQQPLQACYWLNLAACLRGLKQCTLPARVVKRGLSLHPADHDLQQALLQALAEMGLIQQAKRVLQTCSLEKVLAKDNQFFNLQFLATSYGLLPAEQQRAWVQRWEQRKQEAAMGMRQLWQDYLFEPLAARRLRVGYLSSDFCNHPVSRFLLPVLQSHDRTVVELWGLHAGPHWDAVSEEVQRSCDHWLDLRACTDLEAARMISDQRLDVLVELGGYTGNSRIGICLYGAAPLQISYLGYPGATYLQSVPGWIGDATLFAHLSEQDRGHRLLEIEAGYMCFPRPSVAPAPTRSGPNRFRFASFNHARKLTDATLALWSRVLAAAPEAELVLKSISFLEADEQQRIHARCERAGIAPEQLVILPWAADLRDHLDQYNQVDVALDPVPYGGATTTAEALWMGVPVVTLHGPGMVGGLSASLLASAGQAHWITGTADAYIFCCHALFQQGVRHTAQRQQLCAQLASSALNQPRRVSAELERLFLQALSR